MKNCFGAHCNFCRGAVTCGLLTSRAVKNAIHRSEQPWRSCIPTVDRLQRDLRLKPEQTEKVGLILRQMADEFANLRWLDVRETEGILAREQESWNQISVPVCNRSLRNAGSESGNSSRFPSHRLLRAKRRAHLIQKRFISSWRISIAVFGSRRLSTFSRRSGSIAAISRTSLLRVLHLAYLLQPMPAASNAEITHTVMSVPVITAQTK